MDYRKKAEETAVKMGFAPDTFRVDAIERAMREAAAEALEWTVHHGETDGEVLAEADRIRRGEG